MNVIGEEVKCKLADLEQDQDLLICTACGTQFDTDDAEKLTACRICDDPRQFIPPSGQSFTTMKKLWAGDFKNKWTTDAEDSRVMSVVTEPKFAIGQRACLIRTGTTSDNPKACVLWDCITYLDQETVDKINSLGGLRGIMISHPHYYTTALIWARVFGCPVFASSEDSEWWCRPRPRSMTAKELAVGPDTLLGGCVPIRVGGHFPGSLVMCWEKRLFIADSIVTVPSGMYHKNRPAGTTSYGFYWSIPNMIPLNPHQIREIWLAIKDFDFETTHGAFPGMDVRDRDLDDVAKSEGKTVKWKIKESMRIQIEHMGFNFGLNFLPDAPVQREGTF